MLIVLVYNRASCCCNQRTMCERVFSCVSSNQWRRKVDIAILSSKFSYQIKLNCLIDPYLTGTRFVTLYGLYFESSIVIFWAQFLIYL